MSSRSLALAVALSWIAPGEAVAQPTLAPDPREESNKVIARTLAEGGDALLEEGHYADAEADFRKALVLVNAPTLHVRLARSLRGEGRLVEAKHEYELTRRWEVSPRSPPPFLEAISQASMELAQIEPRIAHLTVTFGAPVLIDGASYAAGTEVEVNPGDHTVTADHARSEHVHLGEGERRTLALVSSLGGSPFPYRSTGAVAFTLWGVSLVGLGVGVGLGISASVQKAHIHQVCGETSPCPLVDEPLLDHFHATRSLAYVFSSISGACLVAGTVVYLVGKPTSPTPTVALSPWGSWESGGLRLSGEF